MRRVLCVILMYCAGHGMWGHRCYAAGIAESGSSAGFAAYLEDAALETRFLASAATTSGERAEIVRHLRGKYGDDVLGAILLPESLTAAGTIAQAGR